MESDHFEGLSTSEHLKKARKKTHALRSENHSLDPPGLLYALIEKGKDGIFFSLLLLLPIHFKLLPISGTIALTLSLVLWSAFRTWHLSSRRLQVLHRVISEEKYEIEHNREQERIELIEMYEAKGFKGSLLKQVIDVLMADQNRLLGIMLEEELGLKPHFFEHPIRQGIAALAGTFVTAFFVLISFIYTSFLGAATIATLLYMGLTIFSSKLEKVSCINASFWGASGLVTSLSISYLLCKHLLGIL